MAELPTLDDPEGARVPEHLRVIDAHVHLFPDDVFAAIRRWFEENAWQVRYQLSAIETVDFLLERGIERVVALTYAHKPGLADLLNRFMADIASSRPAVAALGTVLPGEPGARDIVARALGEQGLAGIKIHCHVQCVAPNAPEMDVVYEEAARAGKPVLIHAGREPALSGAYRCDPHQLCSAAAIGDVFRKHPEVTIVVPHFGADEYDAFELLLAQHPRLYLDTTMMLAGYFATAPRSELIIDHADRILYGTDFPNIPYAWDRELRLIEAMPLSTAARRAILSENAARVFWGEPAPPA
jgi:predicted TIM-barrel fold metal-dependent hydrolase